MLRSLQRSVNLRGTAVYFLMPTALPKQVSNSPPRMPSECILNAFSLTCGVQAMSQSLYTLLGPWIRFGCYHPLSLMPEHDFSLHTARERAHQDDFSYRKHYGLIQSWKWGISNRCNPKQDLLRIIQTKPAISLHIGSPEVRSQ